MDIRSLTDSKVFWLDWLAFVFNVHCIICSYLASGITFVYNVFWTYILSVFKEAYTILERTKLVETFNHTMVSMEDRKCSVTQSMQSKHSDSPSRNDELSSYIYKYN